LRFMSEVLKGLRVIELGSGPVTGITGMVLADFGAEVLRIERPDGDPLSTLPAAPMWARGKRNLVLDLSDPASLEALDSLCASADVLLCNLRMSSLKRKGLGFVSLHERHPHLIYCHISGFGNRGPLADLPGYEHVVAAYAGRMLMFQGIVDRQGPVLSAVQVGVHAASQSAAAGILAAVLQRGEQGLGRLVETSLLQGMLPYEMGSMIGRQFPQQFELLMPFMQVSAEPPSPSLYYHPAQTGDGKWMQMGNLLPHLFDNFLIATDLLDVLGDPAFDGKQMFLRPEDKQEAFRERMLKRMQDRPAPDWMNDFVADGGIVATTYQTTQQALSDPDIVANGHVLERQDGGVQIGPLARLTKTPATPGEKAVPGKALIADWRKTPRPPPIETSSTKSRNIELPLKGVRVVELATIIAAPLGAAFLADMGADVIKVEQIGGDPFRSLLAGVGAARVNAGKRSISVNLKTDEGRQAVLDVLSTADVIIHNYRPGVPERLGIDYEQVRNCNPDVVYLQSNGYGPDGPGALRPSTHPIPGAAMGGVMYQMAEHLPEALQNFEDHRMWCSRLMRANELNPDPSTALVVATSALLGLSARQRTGRGQQIFVDMFGANAYANADDFLSYPGKPQRPMPDELLHGLSPTYRLYQCKDDHWVFLALTTDKEKTEFISALKAADIDVPADLKPESLTTFFATRNADEWQSALTSSGVACVRADRMAPSEFWLEDEQVQLMGFTADAIHPALGAYKRHGSLVQFDGEMSGLNGPPLAGEHNQAVLAECGYKPEQIEQLVESGVLWQEMKP
jgi:crotonobetainyl-CoA:carnitine CoA-transferase CaiB-like acyl-CoA transferase